LTVSEGELRLTASDFRGSAAATGWVAYDGIPNDVFDGTQGELFADLTGAGAFDRLLIELGEYSAAFAVEVEVSDGDSSASRSQGPFGAGLEVVAFEFNLFPGIDFSDVRALSVSIFTIAQRGAQVSVARIALGPCVGVCTSGTTQLDREERACVNAINRDWAHVLGRQSRDNVKCVEDAASGKLPIDQCLGQDLGGKVEKARKRTRRTEAAKCEPIGMPGPDDFGFTDNMTANEAASTAALDAFRSVFGDVPALAEEEIDPQGAACQREVVQQLGRSMDLWARELNHGKRAALRGASDGAPPVANPRDLASVIDATIAAIQVHGRIEKAKGRVHARITKQCDGVAIDGLFDCVGLDSCVVGRAFQAACESMELADGLELDCRPVVVLGL